MNPEPGDTTMRIHDQTLYLTDNGAVYCGQHLGATARYTGRDISGQPIEPVTPEIVRAMQAEFGPYGQALQCEVCGREPSLLHTPGGIQF